VSSPTTISYLPTALGTSKATLLLGNIATSGPYAWQLPQCTISSNPYGGYTGTFGLLNCIAIQNGALSAVVWFYVPPGGQGGLLGFQTVEYPYNPPSGWIPWFYVGIGNILYLRDVTSRGAFAVTTPISPGWHMAVAESWASSYTGPYYIALYLDGNYVGSVSTNYLPALFGAGSTYSYNNIGAVFDGIPSNTPSAPNGWFFFNGAIALVALYNRVLTTGDVLAIYQGNLVTSGLVAVWYGDDYNPSNGYWVSRVGGYTGAPVTSSYPPRGCIEWNSAQYSGPVGIWSNWQQC